MKLSKLRGLIAEETYSDEHAAVVKLTFNEALNKEQRLSVLATSKELVALCRADKHGKGTLDSFLEEFGLSNKEGVALMCLAEALLRVPDSKTADKLISEKILNANWAEHKGKSDSLFVNASTWGLMLTGTIIELPDEFREKPSNSIRKLISKLGEPVVRGAVLQAMRIMGGQYVLGRSIGEAVKRGTAQNAEGTRFSFDMLGEAARTDEVAERYFESYASAIEQIGTAQESQDPITGDGISVKLSALHPRYHQTHKDSVMRELLPRIKALCVLARKYNLGLSIDAEESERLELSLDIFESLARDKDLAQWQGLGLVLQAYQKRAPRVVDWIVELAQQTQRRFPIRLVKGAYWDAEIKRAQELGLEEYPVFTRKANTDACYLHCAEKMLKRPLQIYPQFATHNAYTAVMIMELAGDRQFEFQRLHGMGQVLYTQLERIVPDAKIPIRVYAPVGSHEDLLPYLVRRLLENGANSSFVNRFLDSDVPVDELVQDVYSQALSVFPYQHSEIERPADIFFATSDPRENSVGFDIEHPSHADKLLESALRVSSTAIKAGAIVNGETIIENMERVVNPANNSHIVGWISETSRESVLSALGSAHAAQRDWESIGSHHRAKILRKAANLLEGSFSELVGSLTFEAGRTINDCVSEVREAIDFCRYYANQAELIQPEGSNLKGRGVFLCISPWNFPLAIFVGQVAAALVSGNSVLAKPAEQTPLIAFKAVQLLHKAGVPENVLHLLPGDGAKVASPLISDERLSGVVFTGSTETARLLYQQIAHRPGRTIPLIAETGGQNCMIADSTALPEQLVDDVIQSAFSSAGQRCSALRVLFIQEDIADKVIHMLKGALASQHVGNPWSLATDIGPVIDENAQNLLRTHIRRMKEEARLIGSVDLDVGHMQGSFVAPHIFEIDSLEQLDREVFGPILHVIRYRAKDIDSVLSSINDTGYGLTLGVHSRIEGFAKYVYKHTNAGNTYVNRNMIGAVVGVNPFGGTGLSGTGPKAGGPNYLYRFCESGASQPDSADSNAVLVTKPDHNKDTSSCPIDRSIEAFRACSRLTVAERSELLKSFASAMDTAVDDHFNTLCEISKLQLSPPTPLPGPTGEENLLSNTGKGVVACIPSPNDTATEIGIQAGIALAAGCSVILIGGSASEQVMKHWEATVSAGGLDPALRACVTVQDSTNLISSPNIAAVLASANIPNIHDLRVILAQREGPLTPLVEVPTTLQAERPECWTGIVCNLITERTYTDNLVAKGGNTQLFNLEEKPKSDGSFVSQ